MSSKTSKGIAAMFAAVLILAAFASSAFAGSDVYCDGYLFPGYVSSYAHHATQASTRMLASDSVCVQSYIQPSGAKYGPVNCGVGANSLALVNYSGANLLIAASSVGTYTDIRARIDY